MRTTGVTFAIAALLAGCSGASKTDAPAAPLTAAVIAQAPVAPPSPTAIPVQPSAIPAALLGKWGVGLGDCDPSTGADKGVMTVAPDSLKFFESRAQLTAVKAIGADRVQAEFAFTGEGAAWTFDEELTLQSDGKRLMRREFGQGAMPGPMLYIRCPRP